MKGTGPTRAHRPISIWLIGALLVGVALAGWLLIPSRTALLERQIRDQSPDRALRTLRQLPKKDRDAKPEFYALMELRLRRETLNRTNRTEAARLLTETAEDYARYGHRQDFLEELLAQVDSPSAPPDLDTVLENRLARMPPVAQRAIYERLSRKALAAGKPVQAAEAYEKYFQNTTPVETSTAEMVKLWRQAGRATNALEAIDQFASRSGKKIETLSPELALTRIDLLRETGRPDRAFDAIRDLRTMADTPQLFELMVKTSRESNRAIEILPELRQRAEQQNSVEGWSEVAEIAMAANRMDLAVEASRRTAAIAPKNGRVRFKLGQFSEWSGEPGKAFDEYLKALELGEGEALTRLLALNPGLYRDAELMEAMNAAESKLGDEKYRLNLARLESRLGQYGSAVAHYKLVIGNSGLTVELASEYGQLLMDLFEYPLARDLYAEGLKKWPENRLMQRGLAEALFRVGDFEGSLRQYETLVGDKGDAASVDNYISLAITLAESLGRLQNVIGGLQRQIESPRATSREYQRLAYFEHLRGNDPAMLEVLVAAAKRFPNDESSLAKAAYALGDAKRYDEAAELLKKHAALRTNAELARYYVSLLLTGQKYKEAQAFLEHSVDPNLLKNPALGEELAQIAEANNKLTDALKTFGRLRDLDPNNVRFAMNYARLLSATGKPKEAELVIKPFLVKPSAESLKFAAQVYAEMGEYKTAEAYQRKYLGTTPAELPEAYGFLGDVLLSRGDKVNARRAYQQGVDELLRKLAKTQR